MGRRGLIAVLALFLVFDGVQVLRAIGEGDGDGSLLGFWVNGSPLRNASRVDLIGFGSVVYESGRIKITRGDPYNGKVGDESGELYIVEDDQFIAAGDSGAIPTSRWNDLPIITPVSRPRTLLKFCCGVPTGQAASVQLKRSHNGSPVNVFAATLVCQPGDPTGASAMNPLTGTGCTTSFSGTENAIPIGELGLFTFVGTPTAVKVWVAWSTASEW